jgi:hypothetical protein
MKIGDLVEVPGGARGAVRAMGSGMVGVEFAMPPAKLWFEESVVTVFHSSPDPLPREESDRLAREAAGEVEIEYFGALEGNRIYWPVVAKKSPKPFGNIVVASSGIVTVNGDNRNE